MSRLEDQIQVALGARSEPWFEGLAPGLAAHGWSGLARIGLGPDNYGTARVLAADSDAPRQGSVLSRLGWGHPVRLEPFDETLQRRYSALGLPAPATSFSASEFEFDLADAMALLDKVGPASAAVKALVWSITPVAAEGPEYDTGFSDPDVPFSIFIGAHAPEHRIAPLRLAEGVLHETMHLQLSLIEDVVPLVTGNTYQRFSPWQSRPRPTQGLLHGLYVFRVVQAFLRATIATGALGPEDLVHARRRIVEIEAECAELSDMSSSSDLTIDGCRLVEQLAS